MVKRSEQVARVRIGIISAAVIIAIGIAGYGLYYSLGLGGPPGTEQAFTTLDRPERTGDVEITAYFSYICPYCRDLAELAEEWHVTLPEGIVYRRVHVAYSPSNQLLAKAHLALVHHGALETNHRRIFRAIHDRNRQFDSATALADYVGGYGIDRAIFLRTMGSPRIARDVDAGEREFTSLGLTAVPALVIDGKYVVNMNLGRKQALTIAASLAEQLLNRRLPG